MASSVMTVNLDYILKDHIAILAKKINKVEATDMQIIKTHTERLKIRSKEPRYEHARKRDANITDVKEHVLFETRVAAHDGASLEVKAKVERKTSTEARIEVKTGLVIGENIEVPFYVPPVIQGEMEGRGGFKKIIILDKNHVSIIKPLL